MRLSTVSAVVTGAAGGIGNPLCHRLVAAGARVLLVGRRADRLGDLAEALTVYPLPGTGRDTRGDKAGHGVDGKNSLRDRVEVLAVDLTTAGGRQAVRDAAFARRANVLINGAAIPSFGPFESLDDEHLQRVIQTDLVAPIALTRLMLPVLRAAPQASILNIGSALGSIGMPGFTVYAAAKSGIRGFSEALRRELAGTSIRVQYLGARATRTGFNDARVDEFNLVTRTRSDSPDAVAAAALALLASGDSQRFLGLAENLLVRLNGVLPTWLDRGFGLHRRALERSCALPATVPLKELE